MSDPRFAGMATPELTVLLQSYLVLGADHPLVRDDAEFIRALTHEIGERGKPQGPPVGPIPESRG